MGKIIVTGGAGFVGSHLVEELVNNNKDVLVIDDFSNGRIENLKNVENEIEIIKLDISIPFNELQEHFKDLEIDGIFHLACFPRSLSLKNPYRDLEVNALGTLNVLELAKLNNCKVVFTSNSGIYGEPQYLPIDEKHPNNPTTPYDANKLVSEYYLKIYYRIYGVPIGICRLATVYGERQRTSPKWKPLIAEFVAKLMNDEQPTIYWDGEQTRDLIYVKDIVQGLTKAFNNKTDEEVFILGTTKETSVNMIYESICENLGKDNNPNRGPKMDGDIRRMLYSSEKAKKWFDFEPKYDIKQGVSNYIDWLKTEI